MECRFEPRSDHLFVEAKGRFDTAAARRFAAEMVAACERNALDRILVDARGLSDPVSVAERHDLGAFLAGMGAHLRIAVLVVPAQLFSKALENTAVNRGAPVRTTASAGEAAAFLGIAAGP